MSLCAQIWGNEIERYGYTVINILHATPQTHTWLLHFVKVNKPRHQNNKLECTVKNCNITSSYCGLTWQQAASFLPSMCMISGLLPLFCGFRFVQSRRVRLWSLRLLWVNFWVKPLGNTWQHIGVWACVAVGLTKMQEWWLGHGMFHAEGKIRGWSEKFKV
jgi:hypothetical protein